MDDRLFSLDEIPEVPLLRVPRGSRGAPISDERLSHDYPPEWNRCATCNGRGKVPDVEWLRERTPTPPVVKIVDFDAEVPLLSCPDCLGMGSAKARVRLEAGHRCVRCGHPYMPKGDAKMLGVEPSGVGGEHMGGRWSACDLRCTHPGPIRYAFGGGDWLDYGGIAECGWLDVPGYSSTRERLEGARVEAEWRILTVHHLDGDKANLRWWNLVALCQVCHLTIQGRVVMERIYPHEHSEWFRPYVAGYYAYVYLGEELDRPTTESRLDELLALELVST